MNLRKRSLWLSVGMAVVAAGWSDSARAGAAGASTTAARQFRRPVALTPSADGTRLYVANAGSGSVSVVDTGAGRVVGEWGVGRELADLARVPDGQHILAVDRGADALLLLDVTGDRVRVVARTAVAPDPVRVAVSSDGSACAVTSTASRRVSLVSLLTAPSAFGPGRTLDLPFSPRDLLGVERGARVIVADAYGGKLAVVHAKTGVLESVHSIPAHNMRGLALTPDGRTLVIGHQVLKRVAKTDFEDVHWGRLVTSHVRSLRLDAVLAPGPDGDVLRGGCTIDLGFAGSGAGDPSALAVAPTGQVAVALGGVDEVALSRSATGYVKRIGIGARPSAVAFSPDGQLAYVADTLDDTLSVVSVAERVRVKTIALGPRPEPTAVDRGERLFLDARLSHDGWMSCHSCHTDGESNGLVADTLGDGSYGAPKRVPSLLGVGTTGPWAWNGQMERLEDQVRKSITVTMQGRPPAPDQVADLAAYLRSLSPRRAVSAPEQAVARGQAVFEQHECGRCHAPPDYTSPGRYDVGLADEVGNRRFNPPSLRGVGFREPLLHDGRAGTLGEVFLKHGHPGRTEWTTDEVADLVGFLRSL